MAVHFLVKYLLMIWTAIVRIVRIDVRWVHFKELLFLTFHVCEWNL